MKKYHIYFFVFISFLSIAFFPVTGKAENSTEALREVKSQLENFQKDIFSLEESLAVLPARDGAAERQSALQEFRDKTESLEAKLLELQLRISTLAEDRELTTQLNLVSSGREVEKLQEILRLLPDLYPQGLVTGDYGSLTEAAVRRFQKQYGLPETGVVDEGTRMKLNEVLALMDVFTVRGRTETDSGTALAAFIWAWSEKGKSVSARADQEGNFALSLSRGDIWRLGAAAEESGFPYKSSEVTILPKARGEEVVQHLVLVRISEKKLPPSLIEERSAEAAVMLETQDGASVDIPARAAQETGNVTIEFKPTIEAPSQKNSRVVSTVYDINLRDDAGRSVKDMRAPLRVTIPYDETFLKKQGVNEAAIQPAYFDEGGKTWKKIQDFTIDKEKNIVVVSVSHLTRFALIAAADITPPEVPTRVAGSALGGGKVKLTWKNPARDFSHSKVYRSERKGELGFVIAAEVALQEFIDENIINARMYYYNVRAVDPAGNESTNMNQIRVVAQGTSVGGKKRFLPLGAPGRQLSRNLSLGNSGEDVKALQEALVKEGVYPEGLITGYFGALTRQAVIRFQEKYAQNILVPVGLSRGSGFVGRFTREKIQELFNQ